MNPCGSGVSTVPSPTQRRAQMPRGGADRRPVVVLQVGKKGRLIGWIAAAAER